MVEPTHIVSQSTWDMYFDQWLRLSVYRDQDKCEWNDWSESPEFTDNCDAFSVYVSGDSGPLVICLHGAGHTGRSWSLLAKSLRNTCRVAAFDCRGHGMTQCSDNGDLSCQRLVNDAKIIITQIVKKISNTTTGESEKLIVMGHSMGGAIATKAAAELLDTCRSKQSFPILSVILLDVVEGTALTALPYMKTFVEKFPKSFNMESDAIEWALNNEILSNQESARISIPSQLQWVEEEEQRPGMWVWRTNLLDSERYWRGWFEDMSETFVKLRCNKIIILSGPEVLDTPLLIAQMQGKIQVCLVPKTGHIIEEDESSAVCDVIVRMLERHRHVPN